MKILRTALTCLVQPASLLAVAALLINDHVFKVVAPSWLTGKLSDFTGLFFFPFLLAIAFVPWRLNERAMGMLAVLITGLWFTLIKISPEVNGLTEQLASTVTGSPSQIVLDWTDLMALVSLWPAWKLWVRLCDEAPPPSRLPRRLEWLMLGVASLATMAASCAFPPSVEDVMAWNNILYIRHTRSEFFLSSTDGGQTWLSTENQQIPAEVAAYFKNLRRGNSLVCDSLKPEICFRFTEQPLIEQSIDGGKTWQTSWEIPLGRAEFVKRYHNPFNPFDIVQVCADNFAVTIPNALAVITLDNQVWVVAAMRTDGFLLRYPDGHWEQNQLLEANPTPYIVSNPLAYTLGLHEFVNWAGGGLLLVWFITAWQMQIALTSEHSKRTHTWVLVRLRLTALLLLGWVIFTATFSNASEAGYLWPQFLLSLPLIAIVLVSSGLGLLLVLLGLLGGVGVIFYTWRMIDWPGINQRVIWASIVLAVVTVFVGYAPFPFWAQGVITEYNTARYIALGATVVVWLAGGFWLKRLAASIQ